MFLEKQLSSKNTTVLKAIVPFVVGIVIAFVPAPAGLTVNAWYFFALFAAVIAGVITEPIPAAAVGVVGIVVAAAAGLVFTVP